MGLTRTPFAPGSPEHLRAYLAEAARRRHAWGELDCCLFMADWVQAVTGRDPAGPYRGAYDGPRQALRLLRAEGGLYALSWRLAEAAGLPLRLGAPQPGDVGVVLAARRQMGAIRTGKGWAVLTPGGYAVARLPHLAAWEV